MRVKRGRRQPWNMSFASMSDIAFLLIIFFAVAGRFSRSFEQDVPIPAAALGERSPAREFRIVVTEDGQFYLNGNLVHDGELLAEELGYFITEDMDREARTVTLYADADAPYEFVTVAIDAITQADGYLELAVRQGQ